MNMNMDFRVVKYKHIKNRYYALYEMTKEMWAIAVYADDEDEILFSCVELDYAAALHRYNQVKNGDFLESLY